ncbi:MAG TPA: hypothetical protein DEP35_22430 [Deltaproteobacteria bacterium]|nr:hypothetical protein [Deltaproteobacteria bacterium]
METQARESDRGENAEPAQQKAPPAACRTGGGTHHLLAQRTLRFRGPLLLEPAQRLQDRTQPSFPPACDAASLGTP